MQNTKDLIEIIHSRGTELLQPDKSGKGYICPLCGSGTGSKGTGMTTKDGIHFTCWNCGMISNNDILDIIGMEHGITTDTEKIKKAAELLNVSIDGEKRKPPVKRAKRQTEEEEEPDFWPNYKAWHNDIDKTDYHRGISKDTLDKFYIGYCKEWVHPSTPNAKPTERLIIPVTRSSYNARDISGLSDKKYQKVGKAQLFNIKALKQEDNYIFIVEGEIDALSIIDLGFSAIGIGSTQMKQKFLDYMETQETEKILILALDNDNAPNTRATQDGLAKGLKGQGKNYYSSDPGVLYGKYKDANECLTADRENFKERLAEQIRQAEAFVQECIEANKSGLEAESVSMKTLDFMFRVKKEFLRPVSTGFKNLDKILGGGLYPGLYTIGAISSLGKTTFLHQIADQIASINGANKKVLFYSLEQDTEELIAKSVSRLSFMYDDTPNGSLSFEVRDILTGSRYADYTEQQEAAIYETFRDYAESIGNNLYIKEAAENTTYKVLREEMERHLNITGQAPIIVIDYLQIMTPPGDRLTDKQAIDKQVTELKKISRDYKIPVIVISSFNRQNYTEPVSLSSFKESGAIEYSADVLIGLQYDGMDYKKGEKDSERTARVRELLEQQSELSKQGKRQNIQVKVLKNRNGYLGNCNFDYYKRYNYFEEA